MKLILFFLVSCLALHHGRGAPGTAVYKFVKCNPEGDQANCVTQQSPKMAWSPDLPAKLPASTAQYLEAKAEQELESEMYEDENQLKSEEGESSVPMDGSGGYEGSADMLLTDWASGETGSGEFLAEKDEKLYKVGDMSGMRQLFPSWFREAKPAERELREDRLLQL